MKRRWISLLLTGTLVLGSLAMSGCGNSSDSGDADTFSWWIVTTDGDGTYYDKYGSPLFSGASPSFPGVSFNSTIFS